ncbi:hypothetical protein M153_11580003, partial [Pseudoloma neurophilia]
ICQSIGDFCQQSLILKIGAEIPENIKSLIISKYENDFQTARSLNFST